MRLNDGSSEKLAQHIRTIIGHHLSLDEYRIFFFGSRVRGEGDDRSDIDIGVEGPRPIPPRAKAAIEDEIDALPLMQTIEIVDFATVSPEFRADALRQIELIP